MVGVISQELPIGAPYLGIGPALLEQTVVFKPLNYPHSLAEMEVFRSGTPPEYQRRDGGWSDWECLVRQWSRHIAFMEAWLLQKVL